MIGLCFDDNLIFFFSGLW